MSGEIIPTSGGRVAVVPSTPLELVPGSGGPGGRPWSQTIPESIVKKIDSMPPVPLLQGFETPPHPKKRRARKPLIVKKIDSMPPVPLLQGFETPPHPKKRRAKKPADRASSDPVEPPTPTSSRSTFGYGSEPSSDEGDNDELAAPLIPRVFTSVLETPIDAEEPIADHTAALSTSTASTAPVALTETHQPCSFLDFHWKTFPSSPIPPESRRERFANRNVGPTTPYDDPYDVFIAIWDRPFMEHITYETNRYARQLVTHLLYNKNLYPRSRMNRWRDTTVDELYVYFAINIAMGMVVKSRLEEYWCTTEDIFCTPGFRAYMAFNRFLLLNKCLHFNNNEDMFALELDASDAKLFKIEPVVTHLNMKFQAMYNLGRNISIDDSLLMWKGWLDINQVGPNKAAAMKIKTYEVYESQTGYLWRFETQSHKRSPSQQSKDPLDASIPALVLRLLHDLEHKGHTVWLDNFYNSPALARRLKTLGFDCVGTLRTNRKFVPPELHSLTKTDMRQGEITGLTSGDVDVVVWRDNHRVAMISTYHGNAVHTSPAHRRNRQITKPKLIFDYNIMMGGVDKKDQMLAMFPIERTLNKVWYKKLFRRLLNISVLNGYLIHRQSSSSPLSHRHFRVCLVNSLLNNHCTGPISFPPPLRPSAAAQNGRIDLTHRLSEYPLGKHQRLRRQCKICKTLVQTFCVGCDKTVCMEPCFVSLHSYS